MNKIRWSLPLLILGNVVWSPMAVGEMSWLNQRSMLIVTRPDVDPLECRDFLADWQQKPKELHLFGCPIAPRTQYQSITAKYTVTGTDTAKVEKFLRQKFRMSKLRFVCCGWESRNGSYRDSAGFYYEIAMTSEETLEKNWRKIPEFHVWVKKYITEP
jgi:Domian of unknown function (DUF4952)